MSRAELEPIHMPAPGRAARHILLLPHAGGSSSWYRCLSEAARDCAAALWAVRYPGHAGLFAEPLGGSIEEIARLVIRAGDARLSVSWRELVLFGHSMGALVAVEMTRVLRDRGTAPHALHVSSCRDPGTPPLLRRAALPDERLVDALGRLDPEERNALEDADIAALFLPVARADLAAAERYRPVPEALGASLHLHVGQEDEETPERVLAGWQEWTEGELRRYDYPGGHFWPRRNQAALLRHLTGEDA